jgi:TRIAD3 protein (E3 ubiquitin-protein ligase RNF216)
MICGLLSDTLRNKATHRKQKQNEEVEKLNEEEHIQSGNLVECQCCYSDVPSNRTVPCDGASVHFFCFTCIQKTAKTQIGLMKYKLQCLDTSECKATFARWQLGEALGPSLMGKLDHLQQQDEIEQAGLDGLENCPFCDFKAICPPVEEDREFRCYNPSCEAVSCRLCKDKSHIPKTCDEVKKEKGLPARHMVEEAMSEALIRNCPKCKVKIIKDAGCNKMICSKCLCVMCYLCKKDISREQYNHFGKAPTYCDTHDERKPKRFEEEIEQAQKTAIDKILSENPDLTEEQLRVNTNKKTAKTSANAHRHQRPVIPQPPLPPYVHAQRCRARRAPGFMPDVTQHILPQINPQRRPQHNPPFGPAADFPVLHLPARQRTVIGAFPTLEPQLNEPGVEALPAVAPQNFGQFPGLPQHGILPNNGTFPLKTDPDNVTNTGNQPVQPQFPALANYDPATIPGQSANTPLWLDGPLYYNFWDIDITTCIQCPLDPKFKQPNSHDKVYVW